MRKRDGIYGRKNHSQRHDYILWLALSQFYQSTAVEQVIHEDALLYPHASQSRQGTPQGQGSCPTYLVGFPEPSTIFYGDSAQLFFEEVS